jgi:hypothetical protein
MEEHLFMHACLAANLRVANILLRSGRARKEHAAFVVRFLWRQGKAWGLGGEEPPQASGRAQTENHGQGSELNPKDCAVAIFELSRALFPDFVSLYRDDLWAEIALAWARGGASRQTLQHTAADPLAPTLGPRVVRGFGDAPHPRTRDEQIR